MNCWAKLSGSHNSGMYNGSTGREVLGALITRFEQKLALQGLFLRYCCHPAVTREIPAKAKRLEGLNYMVSQGRFERPTFPLGGGCSIQLSYWDK